MGRYMVGGTALLIAFLIVLTVLMLPLVATAQRPGQVRRSGKQVRHSNRGHKHTSLCIASALSGCAKEGNKRPFG